MADPHPGPDTGLATNADTGLGPDLASTIGAPRWVKVVGIVALVLALLVAVMLLFGGGSHGPGRHMSRGLGGPGPADGLTAPAVQQL
jgi:hypothetical protein